VGARGFKPELVGSRFEWSDCKGYVAVVSCVFGGSCFRTIRGFDVAGNRVVGQIPLRTIRVDPPGFQGDIERCVVLNRVRYGRSRTQANLLKSNPIVPENGRVYNRIKLLRIKGCKIV